MDYLKISVGILFALAASRFIPHPPNFTSLLALSFYIPVLFGIKFLPFLLISFIITDFIIGFHPVILFTWGSVILIGLISKFFISNITSRILGALSGACLFFIITNFGVWSLGSYGYTLEGFITCYIWKYNYKRALCEDLIFINEFFNNLNHAFMEYGIIKDDIWNFNKTRFAIGIISTAKVVYSSDYQGKPCLL